ncbi:SH3 domain-containing protein [Peribacillus asahii]|uniref:SH3 domain-containing protein n=1 Tax=Peribacillus asahii TaxID=228899 RepID=UPI00207AF892|nr:SH3 domain-containing protein [Peribacillus asahii]USK58574.1 SH3 domain-containing protein [Peribacillus asahii]
MKKLFKTFITFILVLAFFSFNSSTTEAATTKIAHVNIKSGTLNVRSGAGTKYKKVGSLKKDAGVYVYSKTKSGWSEIRYKKKKAYVMTKYLKFADSYLRDKSKVYTYRSSDGEKYQELYTGESYDGWDEWVSNEGIYIMREDTKGLYEGVFDGGYSVQIEYPIKVGKSWAASDNEDTARILSVNKTIKTPAGTFKNVVEVRYKYSDGYFYTAYFTKNVGLIKIVSKNKKYYELVSLKKR